MKKVWLVMQWTDYEGGHPQNVHATRAGAAIEMQEYVEANNMTTVSYSIVEMDLED